MMISPDKENSHKKTIILIASVFIAGLCSIVYELLISTVSSYFLGDSVKQFSITIGLYMAAMGIGSYVSRLIKRNLLSKFIFVEIILGFLGGTSIPILYAVYAFTDAYSFFMVLLITAIGFLIGLEIPLLTRIMEEYYTLSVNISNVLSVDYLGALIATMLFPFVLLPLLGTFRSSLFFGIINMGIGFMNLWCFSDKFNFNQRKIYKYATISVCLILTSLLVSSQFLIDNWSNSLYEDRIIFSKQTKYQKIVVTSNKDDVRLYLDGNLQFSSIDEYRYHEALVHVPMSLVVKNARVLVLGGGDGLAARELLKYSGIESICIVDLDPDIISISRNINYLKKLNEGSLENSKVTIFNEDAFVYLSEASGLFDLIISDLPDPNNVSLSRLYSKEFYRLVSKRLSSSGLFVAQATSPFFSNKAFWCVHNTIKEAGFKTVLPYHVYVPSFGDWGFVLACQRNLDLDEIDVNVRTRYVENRIIKKLFTFEKDLMDLTSECSTIDRPVILTYYLDGWRYWN